MRRLLRRAFWWLFVWFCKVEGWFVYVDRCTRYVDDDESCRKQTCNGAVRRLVGSVKDVRNGRLNSSQRKPKSWYGPEVLMRWGNAG